MGDNKTKRISRNRSALSKPAEPAPASVPVEAPPAPTAELESGAAAIALAAAEAFEPAPAAAARAAETVADSERAEDFFALGRGALSAFAESQTAMARGLEAIAVGAAALARSGRSAVADAAAAMLDARTPADAVEIQAGFSRRSIDTALDGSTRLSEIAVKATAEASRPILARIDEVWRAG